MKTTLHYYLISFLLGVSFGNASPVPQDGIASLPAEARQLNEGIPNTVPQFVDPFVGLLPVVSPTTSVTAPERRQDDADSIVRRICLTFIWQPRVQEVCNTIDPNNPGAILPELCQVSFVGDTEVCNGL